MREPVTQPEYFPEKLISSSNPVASPRVDGYHNTMFSRTLSLLFLLACAGNTAFGGVMTLEREAPVVEAGFSISDDLPTETAVVLQTGDGTDSMAVASAGQLSTSLAVVSLPYSHAVEALQCGHLRLWNACLPPSPVLDSLLKPS